jgi:hypothetical protein
MIFFMVTDGRPVLERASVLMQEFGVGFHRHDALLDAYERTLVDLVSDGDIDDVLLDDLLWGKYRNPLFGLVGAHFLMRRLAKTPSDEKREDQAKTVIENLGKLLGHDVADIQALHMLRAEALGHEIPPMEVRLPPLLRPALQAIFRATASSKVVLHVPERDMALGALDSPWNCWRRRPSPIKFRWETFPKVAGTLSGVTAETELFTQRVLRNHGLSRFSRRTKLKGGRVSKKSRTSCPFRHG